MKNAIIFHCFGGSPDSFWIPWLKQELEKKGYSVWAPQLPNPREEKLSDWLPYAIENGHYDNETVLIGHSSGAALILSILDFLDVEVKQAILVSGFYEKVVEGVKSPIIPEEFHWDNIRKHAHSFVFINSDNDPFGCNDKVGAYMQSRLGGRQITTHDGHMGSLRYGQPYKEFPMLLNLIEKDNHE